MHRPSDRSPDLKAEPLHPTVRGCTPGLKGGPRDDAEPEGNPA